MSTKRASASRVEHLVKRGLIHPPKWLVSNLMFEAIVGSEAYGCRDPVNSDHDIVGFTIPPKHIVFPHLAGHVPNFNSQSEERFKQIQEHHIRDDQHNTIYDVTIYGIVKFFQLTAANNPNMVDNLFVPLRCVTKHTEIYGHVRENRKMFLSKRAFHTFRGYASQQVAKLKKETGRANPQRQQSIEKYGYDVKYGYNIVRLMLECEQILQTGDLHLDRDAKTYVAIRTGEWSKNRLMQWMEAKERALEESNARAIVPERVDMEAIERLLRECLEIHFGSIAKAVTERDRDEKILDDIEALLRRYQR